MERIFCRGVFLSFVVVLFMAFTSSAVMASGIQITEKGTKGLGNAWAGGAAVAEDASTVYWNPAGLTRLDGTHLELSVHFIRPSFKWDDKGSTITAAAGGAPLTGSDGGDAGGPNFVPNFFASHAINENWRVGLGIFLPFGLETDYGNEWKGRYYTTKSELLTVDINPSVAYRISSQWSVGGGFSVQYIDAELNNAIDYGTISGGAVGLPQNADGTVKLEADDWAWGFNLGVLFELNENTRFGLTYRSRVDYEIDDGTAEFQYPDPAVETFAGLIGLVDGGVSTDIEMPANASLSAYHKLSEKWAIMATVTWTEWSTLDELRIKFDNPPLSGDNVTTLDWDNSMYYAIGATWYFDDQWTFRGGLAYDETPVPNAQRRNPRVPDDDRYWISGSASYEFLERWGVDFAGTYIFADDAEINKAAVGEDLTRGNLIGDYDAWSYILSLQVNYTF